MATASQATTIGEISRGTIDSSILDLSFLPPIYLLSAHIEDGHRHNLEDLLLQADAPLTYDPTEARIIVGNVNTKRRAELELRTRQVLTEAVKPPLGSPDGSEPRVKRARLDSGSQVDPSQATEISGLLHDHVYLVQLGWLEDLLHGEDPPLRGSLVYEGRLIEKRHTVDAGTVGASLAGPGHADTAAPKTQGGNSPHPLMAATIKERAHMDARSTPSISQRNDFAPSYGYGPRKFLHHDHGHSRSATKSRLIQQTTSDYEGSSNDELPDPPDWVKKGVRYACERVTPAESPNAVFIEQLKKIRLTRILTDDEIGVRAYSTSIAALAAYPYKISQAREILRVPGCDVKIANLWVEWKNNDGRIGAVEAAEEDEAMKILRDFYDIWGVGATTAREFYFDRGWRDRDDIVEYGWQTLSRVQQIGVKYYDELLQGIPRAEVEQIAAVVREHAVRVRDTGIELLVVGGYRRGKERSGDVDMIVSHRDMEKTANLVTDIVASLEAEGWVTHTLLLSLNGTQRGQSTLPFKGPGHGGHGFDTLDKALVVWQDPNWQGSTTGAKNKNPNPHRRVDIIISPWRTVGCAVTGWSGGTTFQRDLRRYAKNKKGWKFDSSGVRSRNTGLVVDLEGPDGVAGSMVDAEKAVFRGMGLEYREPWQRCTH